MNSNPPSKHPSLYSDLVSRRRAAVFMANNPKSNAIDDGGAMENKNENMVTDGKDFGYTIRGEAVLDRSRDSLQLRRGVLPDLFYSRPKKIVHRRRRSRMSSVLGIVTQITLFLAALFYLGQLIYSWTAGSQWDTNSSFAALDFEDRISELQKSLKITAKMLQVQVEVIEKKIGTEIEIVTNELKKHVEEKEELVVKELKRLESITDDLLYSLADLENHDLLTRGEFEKFWHELKSKRNLDDMGKAVILDEIMMLTRDIVSKEIEKHASDGLGRVDYALSSGGARVVMHSEPYVHGKVSSWLAIAKGKPRVHSSAQKMLEPSFGEPGQCFALQGSSGFVEIRLREGIVPEAFTLEHVSKSVAYDRSSAPKNGQVSGWLEGPEGDRSAKIDKFATSFSYDLEKSNAQTFNITMADSGIINMVRLNFTSNHGSSSLTCIYRIRVHGHQPKSDASFPGIAQNLEGM